jgi:hypothetical protein
MRMSILLCRFSEWREGKVRGWERTKCPFSHHHALNPYPFQIGLPGREVMVQTFKAEFQTPIYGTLRSPIEIVDS